jgi:hypothetical protein
VTVDGREIYRKGFSGNWGSPLCGMIHPYAMDMFVDVDSIIYHTGDTAVVLISSDLDQYANDGIFSLKYKESWGFRNFRIDYFL